MWRSWTRVFGRVAVAVMVSYKADGVSVGVGVRTKYSKGYILYSIIYNLTIYVFVPV